MSYRSTVFLSGSLIAGKTAPPPPTQLEVLHSSLDDDVARIRAYSITPDPILHEGFPILEQRRGSAPSLDVSKRDVIAKTRKRRTSPTSARSRSTAASGTSGFSRPPVHSINASGKSSSLSELSGPSISTTSTSHAVRPNQPSRHPPSKSMTNTTPALKLSTSHMHQAIWSATSFLLSPDASTPNSDSANVPEGLLGTPQEPTEIILKKKKKTKITGTSTTDPPQHSTKASLQERKMHDETATRASRTTSKKATGKRKKLPEREEMKAPTTISKASYSTFTGMRQHRVERRQRYQALVSR